MLRVRGFTQDDSHIFCTREQLADEIERRPRARCTRCSTTFGYEYDALPRDPAEGQVPRAPTRNGTCATEALREALERRGIDYQVDEGGGAFYAPKIDIKLKDALGRGWQCPTIQFDFNLPKRFGVTYVGSDGQEHEAAMIHRALLGSLERFVGGLIEHYGGEFPVWLAPVQVR